ncbi:MAG: energy transducer TonB, partial [Myxococcota bacterium]
ARTSGDAETPSPLTDHLDAPGWSSLTILAEDVPEGTEVRVAVRDTPTGRWFTTVDQQLRASWTCPPELRALGVAGTTVVGWRVQRDGDVLDVHLVRSSGNAELDLAALAAVPTQVLPPASMGVRPPRVRMSFTCGSK